MRRTFSAGAPAATVRERIQRYFADSGYTHSNRDGQDCFERGKDMFTAISFSPDGWSVCARVTLMEEQARTTVKVIFDIHVTGQAPSRMENRFWLAEIDGVERAARDNINLARENAAIARKAGAINVFGFALAFTPFFCAYYAGSNAERAQKVWAALSAWLPLPPAPQGSWLDATAGIAAFLLSALLVWLVMRYGLGIFEKHPELCNTAPEETLA